MTEDERKVATVRLMKGERLSNLAREYGVQPSSLLRTARRLGYTERRTSRRLSVDENAFSIVNPASAYWAGFLMADGCVSDAGLLQVRLAVKDLPHLKKFRDFIKSDHKIHFQIQGAPGTDKKFGAVHFAVFSKPIVRDLEKFGVVPRKSLNSCAGECVFENRHFWRGVIDGDGSIGIWGKKKIPTVRLIGSFLITKQFANFMRKVSSWYRITPFNGKPTNSKNKKIYEVSASGKYGVSITKVLYIGAAEEIRLERKFRIAHQIMSHAYGRSVVQ